MVLQGFKGSATSKETSPWIFSASSFLVLLGESEELKHRYLRRSWLECLGMTPVAGLQSYLRAPNSIFDTTGREYANPIGRTKAPLRNMKFHHTIDTRNLLADGEYTVWRIPPQSLPRQDLPMILISVFHLVAMSVLLGFLCWYAATSWIGVAGCLVLPLHAVFLRVSEKAYSQLADLRTSDPDGIDAVYFLGRRNSCLVLEGSRRDITAMTGQGVRMRDDASAAWLANATRITTFLVLVFVFTVIPNGTTWDQLAFIILNILGQLNVFIGQRLNSLGTIRRLELVEQQKGVPSRTHIYAKLISRFGDGDWVDDLSLLPVTDAWARWRRRVVVEGQMDAHDLYDECARQAGEVIEEVVEEVVEGMVEEVVEGVVEGVVEELVEELVEKLVEEDIEMVDLDIVDKRPFRKALTW